MHQQKSPEIASWCLDRANWAADQKHLSRGEADHKFWSDVESKWRAHAKRYLLHNVAERPPNSAWPDDVEPYTRATLNRRTDKLRNKAPRSRWAERARRILAD
jgi:hypothetical protein